MLYLHNIKLRSEHSYNNTHLHTHTDTHTHIHKQHLPYINNIYTNKSKQTKQNKYKEQTTRKMQNGLQDNEANGKHPASSVSNTTSVVYADKLSVHFDAEYERLKKQSDHMKVGEFSVSIQSFYRENQNVKDMQDVLLQLKQHNTPYQYAHLCYDPTILKLMQLSEQLSEVKTQLKRMLPGVDIGNFFTASFIHVIRDEHGQLVGFYIFRVDRKQKLIDLVHFCLLNSFRKKGICTCFIDNFFVPLSCALEYDIVVDTEDLNLIDIWKKIGFTPYHMSITNKTYLRKFYMNGDGGNKQKGNDAFRNNRVLDAVKYYTIAILRGENDDDRPHLLYSNRAFMYEKLDMPHHALNDALTCIRMCETFGKGYHRAAVAHLALNQVPKAYEAYQTAIKVDPDNTVQYEKYLSKIKFILKRKEKVNNN